MKRIKNLWAGVSSFANLAGAAEKAAHGKRKRPNVAQFLLDFEREILRLEDELAGRTYTPGGYYTFMIYEPKARMISAAPFRDRVVHHALCRRLEYLFEARFIHDSYACRRGKGAHAAIDRFTEFARHNRFVLKCDVRKFFPSIDHQCLTTLIARQIKDEGVQWLVDRIVDHSNPQEPVTDYFPGDDLFTPTERRRGLPIGNQTSQFFANVYLNPFDHFVKEVLRARCYIRYVDDFVIFSDSKRWLAEVREQCREFLATLRVKVHPRKSTISRVSDGTPFLGFRVFPTHRRLCSANVHRMRRRLQWMAEAYADGALTAPEIRQRIASWLGHASHADTHHLQQRLLSATTFVRRRD